MGVSSKVLEPCRGDVNRGVEVPIEVNCVVEHRCRGAQGVVKSVVKRCREITTPKKCRGDEACREENLHDTFHDTRGVVKGVVRENWVYR